MSCKISEGKSSVGSEPLKTLHRGGNVSPVDPAETIAQKDAEQKKLTGFFVTNVALSNSSLRPFARSSPTKGESFCNVEV